ncbi:hypothetical protein L1049_007658 [Liquidambar formosana]|uniref:DUF4378 domain-containing protein n=1 Tax=Liquidambar formosana TaxID=63359 RepID=A0AAP0S1W2_LIQFO
MMAHKHLRDLLCEDQEPFLLKDYIADKRGQFKRPLPATQLQLKKRKPISENSNFPGNFCKNACFFNFQDSPDVRKSPFFDFPSPAKSPCKNPNTIFLHIPARTAALLLEAALKIQKHSSSSKPKAQNKNTSFGLFGSILKRLTHRNRNLKREIGGNDGVRVSVKDILRWDSSVGRRKFSEECEKMEENLVGELEERSASEMGFSCSCNGRLSSAVWSETNEEKSLDLETSSSCNSEDLEEIEFVSKERENGDLASCEKGFCKSPFHFVLQKSPSSGCRTPDFSSPATSPSRQKSQEKENYGEESLKKFQVEEEEEEKEQCSPVSVLDPPFEDDDDGHEDDDEDGGFDLESSYAIVQRAKQQLLHKLRRFEKLAELDPIELEKRLLEEEQYDEDLEEVEDCEDDESVSSNSAKDADEFVREILRMSSFHSLRRIPTDMKRLVSDLIAEEERGQNNFNDREVVAKRVCKRLESWREVECNTIDMMVDFDFRKELDGWKKNEEQVREMGMEIELAIFGLLVEELSVD